MSALSLALSHASSISPSPQFNDSLENCRATVPCPYTANASWLSADSLSPRRAGPLRVVNQNVATSRAVSQGVSPKPESVLFRGKSMPLMRPQTPSSHTHSLEDVELDPDGATAAASDHVRNIAVDLRASSVTGSLRRALSCLQKESRDSSLTQRWTLDDFQQTVVKGRLVSLDDASHRKSGSWSSSELFSALRAAKSHLFMRTSPETGPEEKQKQILEELLHTEDGYVQDLKILAHVYLPILAAVPDAPHRLHQEMQKTLDNLITIHESLYTELATALDISSFKRVLEPNEDDGSSSSESHKGSIRRSIEALFSRSAWTKSGRSVEEVAARVVEIFQQVVPRFVVYEEYGAHYVSLMQFANAMSKTIPSWVAYERGIEILMGTLIVSPCKDKKSLTLEDLLIKPVQRICKYPLLFAELRKQLATINASAANAIDYVNVELQKVAQMTDEATQNTEIQQQYRRRSLLSGMLNLGGIIEDVSSLGHLTLCGVLYLAYQTCNDVAGCYMLAAIVGHHLILAEQIGDEERFSVQGLLDLRLTKLDVADNGHGLVCRTASYAWKLLFSIHDCPYELIVCACSAAEEEQWKSAILRQPNSGSWARSIGTDPFWMQDHVSPQEAVQEIIVENTHALREKGDKGPSPRRISSVKEQGMPGKTILAPDRVERNRLEGILEPVWTKDVLPYPGMSPRRSSAFIRSSTRTVMRKLSRSSSITQPKPRLSSVPGHFDPFVDHHDESWATHAENIDAHDKLVNKSPPSEPQPFPGLQKVSFQLSPIPKPVASQAESRARIRKRVRGLWRPFRRIA